MNEPKKILRASSALAAMILTGRPMPLKDEAEGSISRFHTIHPLDGMSGELVMGFERKFKLSEKAQRRRDLEKKAKANYVAPAVRRKQQMRDLKKAVTGSSAAWRGKTVDEMISDMRTIANSVALQPGPMKKPITKLGENPA